MSSEIFELVAENDVKFFVHKDILAHQSKPFKDATNGEWKESTERKIQLSDWDAKTVGRLVQFLYTGDYDYPGPSNDVQQRPGVEEQYFPQSPDEPVPYRTGTLTPLRECIAHAMPERAHRRVTDDTWLNSVDITTLDFEDIFLAHAKVYALAQYKSIAALKALAQERLSRILLKLHPPGSNPHLAKNIVSLATYVYDNTDSLVNSEEPLRKVISHFVALNFSTLQKNPAAVEMMCSGGDLVKDVLANVCRRLVDQGPAPPGTRFISSFTVCRVISYTAT